MGNRSEPPTLCVKVTSASLSSGASSPHWTLARPWPEEEEEEEEAKENRSLYLPPLGL